MSNIPETSSVLLLVGGPEDGRVIAGQEAWFMTKKIGKTNPDGTIELLEAEIGQAAMVMSSRLIEAMQKLGTETALAYFAKCGVSPLNLGSNKYRLARKIDGLYVWEFVPQTTDQPNDAA